jgi:hypothetical protein
MKRLGLDAVAAWRRDERTTRQAHENARRLKNPKPPGAVRSGELLEQAEHDGSNKRECDIRDDHG